MVTAANLIDALRTHGAEVVAMGDRIRIEPHGAPVPREIVEQLKRIPKSQVRDVLRQKRPAETYENLATSPLVARIQIARPWIAENRPDLYQAIRDADDVVAAIEPDSPGYGEALDRLRQAMEGAGRAWKQRTRSESVKIHSRVLATELWIAASEEAAQELHRDGVTLPILLPEEAEVLAGMAEADARALFATLAKIQRVMPGARLRKVLSAEGCDA